MHKVFKSPSAYWVVKGDEGELVDGPFNYMAEAQELADDLNGEDNAEPNNNTDNIQKPDK